MFFVESGRDASKHSRAEDITPMVGMVSKSITSTQVTKVTPQTLHSLSFKILDKIYSTRVLGREKEEGQGEEKRDRDRDRVRDRQKETWRDRHRERQEGGKRNRQKETER